jgi:NADH-ubiquinone oxidoreductase chain 5
LLGPFGLSNAFTNTGINIAKLDTGIITTYSLYITLGLLSLLFLVFAPILIDTSMFSEIRLIIIYVYSGFSILVLSPSYSVLNPVVMDKINNYR